MTEEYSLPFQLFSMYLLAKHFYSNDKGHSPFYMFLHGIAVGIVLNIRPNIVLMWIPIAVFIGCELLIQRDIKCFFMNLVCGIFGVLVGIMPMLIYALANDAFSDIYFGTVKFNTLYAFTRFTKPQLFGKFLDGLLSYRILFSSIAVSMLFITKMHFYLRWKLCYLLMLVMTIIAISLSGYNFGHYYEYLIPF